MNLLNPHRTSSLAAAFVTAVAFLLPIPSARALDKVALEVQVRGDGGVATKGKTDTDTRFLEIKISNRTSENLSDLVVKWVIFAKDIANDATKQAGSGEVKSSLAAMRAEKIEGQSVSMSHTDSHAEKGKGSGQGNKGKGGSKKVKASGERFSGWGVQVLQDGKLVGEAYSRFELKKEM